MNGRIAPMTCGQCGGTMNAHAEKPVVPISADDAERADRGLGALIEEIHQCPRCGHVQSRRVS